MLVVGLQGSPRKKGNTNYLLSIFMEEAARLGARTRTVEVARMNIGPCRELVVCEKKGFCPIDDDMKTEVYSLLWEADVIVVASPIFFYNVTSQLKALIDRCQAMWARKYCLKLADPARGYRRGILLAAGATRGKNLFEGMKLTITYFFDAVGASFENSLTYRSIEGPKDMRNHPTVQADVRQAVERLMGPFQGRKKILFAGRQNACRSQMAGAFARLHGGMKLDVMIGGSQPAVEIDPLAVEVMQEKGIDMAFRSPRSIESALAQDIPDVVVTMGSDEACPSVPGAKEIGWDLPDATGRPIAFMRQVRDDIEKRVHQLLYDVA
jgi:multimeric flavodoxin WrbA